MTTTTGPEPMAKGRPKRSRRNDVTVKIDADVVRMAKLVALERKTTIAEYLTELLRGQVSRDFAKSVRRLTTEEDKS